MPDTTPMRRERVFTSMPRSLGRSAREEIIWEALERIDGKPAPTLGAMQASMGNEAQIRIAHDVIRAYLDAHGRRDLSGLAARAGASA